jgi:hypothetical protein
VAQRNCQRNRKCSSLDLRAGNVSARSGSEEQPRSTPGTRRRELRVERRESRVDLFLIRDLFSVFSEPSVAERNRQRIHKCSSLEPSEPEASAPGVTLEKNHGKDEKHRKEEDGQMADDKSPMTNFFPGYPGSIAPLLAWCRWSTCPPVRMEFRVPSEVRTGSQAARGPRAPLGTRRMSLALTRKNHKPCPAPL